MSEAKCHYCARGEEMAVYGLEVARLSVSTFYLFREQSHPGRCIVALDEHLGDITDLSDSQRNAFFADVDTAARAIHKAYRPDKINYGAFGDLMQHLHFHLVPKYRDGFEWGGVFAMNPGKTTLTDKEYAEAVDTLRRAMKE